MKQHFFHSKRALTESIGDYFKYIDGDYHLEEVPAKTKDAPVTYQKVWDRDAEPPTLSGLAYYLGFNSRNEFAEYEQSGRYGEVLSRARLRVEAEYEKKLHYQSATGAIFALKAMGWNEKTDVFPLLTDSIRIEIINAELQPAGSEKEAISNL